MTASFRDSVTLPAARASVTELCARQRELVVVSKSLLQRDGSRSFESARPAISESRSGRLRLARRGTTMYSMFADEDSSVFRVIDTMLALTVDTAQDNIIIRAHCTGTSSVQVVWKKLTIRAEKLTWRPPPDG
jgi:hypothetical protein